VEEFFIDYGSFLLKTGTIVIAIIAVVLVIVSAVMRGKGERRDHIEIKRLNDQYRETERVLKEAMLSRQDLKRLDKDIKRERKQEEKRGSDKSTRLFILDFDGDVRASGVNALREEITAVLTVANEDDEVFVRVHSAGGAVHSYGLAASQLTRITDRNIRLVVSVDKIAASGGYMMACVANHVLAAPFAVLGSIGVVAQLPNFNRLLKKHDIDYEMITAGEYKRTLTVFGENTEKGREKFREEMEDVHALFKEFVQTHRPSVDIEKVGTGEYWFGTRALEFNLADEIKTSDDYLFQRSQDADLFEINYVQHKGMKERFGSWVSAFLPWSHPGI